MALAGVASIYSLPPEVLETTCGFLDVPTLCTARLVCTQLCDAASKCIHSVLISAETLPSQAGTTLQKHFPNISRLEIAPLKGDYLDVNLLTLPKLTSLILRRGHVLPLPQTLKELNLGPDPATCQTVSTVTGLKNLTCLEIALHKVRKPCEAVTALTALIKLKTRSEFSTMPFVAELTLLTHLDFHVEWRQGSPSDLAPLAPLTCLQRLVHLGFTQWGFWNLGTSLERQVLASIATFTSLRSLDLSLSQRPEESAFKTVNMTPFPQLTALRLGMFDGEISFLPRFELDRLQYLFHSNEMHLNQGGVAALSQATALTHLELWKVAASVEREVGKALSCMSGLRALCLKTTSAFQTTDCSEAIGRLTELTLLELRGRGVISNADVDVFLGLKKLRVLVVDVFSGTPAPSASIMRETILNIAKLPELRNFSIGGNVGISEGDLTDDIRVLNDDRHDRGWPPLKLGVYGPV